MTLQDKINKEPYFKAKNLTDLDDIEYSLKEVRKLIAEYGYTPKLNAILTRITNKKSKLSGTMKLIKGSAAAKSFMKKLRASKGKVTKKATAKKRKISGNKHTDTKSHNYHITISGENRKKLSKDAIAELRSIAKAENIIWRRNAWGTNELVNTDMIGKARHLLIQVILSNGYTSTPSGKLIKATH